ncbi:MAG TPA: DUF3108 domain-containing protein [Gemmatimonadaceae bacterium]|nr:DUF3108 domain-containing protein [Gemmatimonadaceae bacterium]
MTRLATALMLALTAVGSAAAQVPARADATGPAAAHHWPFDVGERMVYQGKFGWLPVGRAEAVVEARDTVRGHDTYRIRFSVNGGPSWFGVHDNYTSWFDANTLVTYRYHQDIHEGRYKRNTTYEIIPESGIYVENGKDTSITVASPLDDESFIYFVRTVPLTVGAHYEWNRYFKADRNPVIVDVVRREEVEVPAGKFMCVVLKPTIKANGLFSEGGHAEIWISDDDRRILVQMKSGLSFGSLNLYLKEYVPGGPAAAADTTDGVGFEPTVRF